MTRTKWLILAGALAILAIPVAIVAWALSLNGSGPYQDDRFRGSEPPSGIALVDFALHDEQGRLVRSRDLRGKVVVLTFLDSQCTEACPVIAFQVARTIDALRGSERRDVVAVAISTDPEEDTPSSVRAFLQRPHALGGLHYLGGSEPVERMQRVWKSFQILSSFETHKDTLHSAPVRIYDRNSIWVATQHAGVDLTRTNLAHDIRLALDTTD